MAKRYEKAMTEGGRDKEALIKHIAHKDIDEYLAQKEPRGQYDPGAMLCFDGDNYIEMADATKEHVQQWRDFMLLDPEHAYNYGNIMYAESRLAIWREEKTLAELEAG